MENNALLREYAELIRRNNELLVQNNKLLDSINDYMRKIAINTSSLH